ncbi:hypothetical protein GGH99_003024 [Coemansia sp. RSA 1285]|nr:hypothetical protein EV177_000201 [Coemansia sp. RSA 1804]KAJ2688472.1 hypothetical protein GGH99_003024 [Coemansia sp. RSA 1285]
MAGIDNIEPFILSRILTMAVGQPAKDMEEWKAQLPFLWVCQKWYKLLRHHVYSVGFVNIYSPSDTVYVRIDRRYVRKETNNWRKHADDAIIYWTNLEIIAGRDGYNCDCVSTLNVHISPGTNIRQFGTIFKDLLTLGVGYWLNLTSLSLNIHGGVEPALVGSVGSVGIDGLANDVSDHIRSFKQQVPNIKWLSIECSLDNVLLSALPCFIEEYVPQLEYLHCPFPLKKTPYLYSTELTHISLRIDKCALDSFRVYVKPLRHLELHNIPDSFSWMAFRDVFTPGCIEFTNLRTLELWFLEQTESAKQLSIKHAQKKRPYGSHMLRFPVLSKLLFKYCPVDCDVLFSDTIPTKLRHLCVSGNSDNIVAASRLRLLKADKLEIYVLEDRPLDREFYDSADYYFGVIRIGDIRRLVLRHSIDVGRTATWVNITHLTLMLLAFDKLLELIVNLYNLLDLEIYRIGFDVTASSIVKRGTEEEERGMVQKLDSKIQTLRAYLTEPERSSELLACINYLLLRIPTITALWRSMDPRFMDIERELCERYPGITIFCEWDAEMDSPLPSMLLANN